MPEWPSFSSCVIVEWSAAAKVTSEWVCAPTVGRAEVFSVGALSLEVGTSADVISFVFHGGLGLLSNH